jgi:hypothetical protein
MTKRMLMMVVVMVVVVVWLHNQTHTHHIW